MLRNSNIINKKIIDNNQYMEIDCNKYKPQSKYFNKNFQNVQKKIRSNNKIAYQEIMSFFVDIRIILIYEKTYILSSKKSPYISYYQAIYRSAKEINYSNKYVYNIFMNQYKKLKESKRLSSGENKKLKFKEQFKVQIIYCLITLLEQIELLKLKVCTFKIYFILNNWMKNER
jgi:hypothetical protein